MVIYLDPPNELVIISTPNGERFITGQSLTSCLFTVCPNLGLRFYNIPYVESQVEVTFHSESMFLCVQLICRKYIKTTEERNESFQEMELEQQMFTYPSHV